MEKERQDIPFMESRLFLRIYLISLLVLFILLVSTPFLIKEGVSILTEEHLEITLLVLLSISGFFMYRDFHKRMATAQSRYVDLSRHVGALNLQTVQIESMIRELARLPKSKRELKRTLETLNNDILAAVNVDWVLIRIVDSASHRTCTEQRTTRSDGNEEEYSIEIPEISNKALVTNEKMDGYIVYASDSDELEAKVFCVLPECVLNMHQETVIRTAIHSISLLYVIFRSKRI